MAIINDRAHHFDDASDDEEVESVPSNEEFDEDFEDVGDCIQTRATVASN